MNPRLALCLALAATACGSDPARPTSTSLTIVATSPASGAVVVVPAAFPYNEIGGVVLPVGSGLVAATVSMAAARAEPWAELNVYLLTGGSATEYCGQNTPDAPTWGGLPAGWSATHTVTGFRVYRLPCEVTGVRAMLHRRNNGLLAPPTPAETIAEATVATRFELRR